MRLKLVIFIGLSFMLSQAGQAQVFDYFQEGTQWFQSSGYQSGSCSYEKKSKFYIKGDSLIAGVLYKKVYKNSSLYQLESHLCDSSYISSSDNYRCLVRQDSFKVYSDYLGTEKLIYDFDLSLNDTLPDAVFYHKEFSTSDKYVVTKVTDTMLGTMVLPVFHVKNVDGSSSVRCCGRIISGISNHTGFLNPIVDGFDTWGDLHGYINGQDTLERSRRAQHNFTVQEENASLKLKLFPIPAKTGLQIELQGQEIHSIQVYSLSGQLQLEHQGVGSPSENIDVSGLRPGVYLLQLESVKGAVLREKIVVM